MQMVMTNYMDLLAQNQPWNLILFMVVPVVLAESLVATEFMMAYRGPEQAGGWKRWNHGLSILAGVYFAGVVLYLLTHVVPGLVWKGWADELAIGPICWASFPSVPWRSWNWVSSAGVWNPGRNCCTISAGWWCF